MSDAGLEQSNEVRRGRSDGIQVISRAAAILRALRDEADGLSLAQIAARVGLPRSTVQRIVGALVGERLLMSATPSGRVRLGTEILSLAAGSPIDVVARARHELEALSAATGETVDMALLKADHMIFVDQVAGSHRLRAVSAVGEVFPLHSTANGKACLALMSDDEVRRLLPTVLPGRPDGGRHTVKDLLAELAEVRRSGIAYDEEDHSPGISAVGVAFRDPAGSIYAMSIPVPTARFRASRKNLAAQLLAAKARLVEALR